jgi:hypothetical protein
MWPQPEVGIWILALPRTELGSFAAVLPSGWTVGSDGDLLAIYPPDGEAYIQISTYVGPEDGEPNAAELWDFAEESLEPSWSVTQDAIRAEPPGFALDAEGMTDFGAGLLAFRLWPGRLLLATFYYEPRDARLAEAARSIFASIRPASAWTS